MDIEFHYYMTYLIATRAKFSPADALLIAHSAQGVDDNHIPVQMTDAGGALYANQLSQTMDILRPHQDAYIYPIFHFIPGEPNAPSAQRVDGRTDSWVTTPDSPLANQMIDAALASKDLYRIGVSAHGYVDTWAHQNFLGKRSTFNEFSTSLIGELADLIMAVGHAHAKHNPDWPALSWKDTRLVKPEIDNRERFLDAARHLYRKFARHVNGAISDGEIERESQQLCTDLDSDIGVPDDDNSHVNARIRRYVARSREPAYGGVPIPQYVTGKWFSEAIQEDHDSVEKGARKGDDSSVFGALKSFSEDFLADGHRQTVTWRNADPTVYRTSHWYRFQEAVKSHLDECKAILVKAGVLSST